MFPFVFTVYTHLSLALYLAIGLAAFILTAVHGFNLFAVSFLSLTLSVPVADRGRLAGDVKEQLRRKQAQYGQTFS